MDRFFELYEHLVRLFALALLAFALGFFLFWVFFSKGFFGAVELVILGESLPFGKEQFCHEQSVSPPPVSTEEPSLTL